MKTNYLALAVAFLVITPLGFAQGTYTQVDYPGASGTFLQAIDSAGDVVGSYLDSNFNSHGFLLSNGVYTPIDYPGAQDTFPLGINDNGQIVGWSRPGLQGFLYDVPSQTFSTVNDPDGVQTLPCCINNAGVMAGSVSNRSGQAFGFELQGSTYRLFTPPGSTTTSGVALTSAGAFVMDGTTSKNPNQYYLFDDDGYSLIHLPKEQDIFIFGVNPQGTAYVGAYQTNPNGSFGYVLENNKTFITLQYPGMSITNAEGINQNGEVVGLFTDSSNNTHGFTWTPPSPAQH